MFVFKNHEYRSRLCSVDGDGGAAAAGGTTGGAAAGGAAAGGGAGGDDGNAAHKQRTAFNAGGEQTGADGRPAGLEDKFWDPATKQVRLSELTKSYSNLQGLVTRRATEMNSSDFEVLVNTRVEGMTNDIRTRALKEWRGDAPKTPADYSASFNAEQLKHIPAHMQDPASFAGDPLIQWWGATAHKFGLSNENYNGAIADYLKTFTTAESARLNSEVSKLGENGKVRVTALGAWFDANFPKDQAASLKGAARDANTIVALEALMKKTGDRSVLPGGGGDPPPAENHFGVAMSTEAELKKAQADPRYHNAMKRDPAFVAAVDAGWKRLYPD